MLKIVLPLMMLGLVSACAQASDSALCIGLKNPVNHLVAVVLAEGSDGVVLATDAVVARFDAGCG